MTFTKAQQDKHRKSFIEDCRQKAWSSACHAGWISKSLDELLATYQKLQAEDLKLEVDIKAAAEAIDYHTVENRERRKTMQERRNQLAKDMKTIATNAQQGQQAMQGLLQSVESALQLAKHAEEWALNEKGISAPEDKPRSQVYILQRDWADRKAGEVLKADEIGEGSIYKGLIAQGVIVEDHAC